MMPKTLTLVALVCAVALATAATAQSTNPNWKGEDNEFGSLRAPYAIDLDAGRAPIEAQVLLHTHYENKDGRFYMFMFTVENQPLLVSFDSLIRTDTGKEINCYKREGESNLAIKCFVDRYEMPPIGTEILMRGSIEAKKAGVAQVGAIVVPFTATWLKVPMSNGLEAELFAGTQVNANTASDGSKTFGGLGNKVPGIGVVGVGVAALAALAIAGVLRRRK
jgi:hypothetical protein